MSNSKVVSHGQSLMDITFSKYILSSRRRSSLPPEEAKGCSVYINLDHPYHQNIKYLCEVVTKFMLSVWI